MAWKRIGEVKRGVAGERAPVGTKNRMGKERDNDGRDIVGTRERERETRHWRTTVH